MRPANSILLALLALLLVQPAVLAATYTVTNTNATGPGSLEAAITQANATKEANLIVFDIPTTDPNYHTFPGGGFFWVIDITDSAGLPAILGSLTIDGFTDPPSPAGNPSIFLNGSAITKGTAHGLTIRGSDVTVRGLGIVGFPGNGIDVSADARNANQNWFYANWIGVGLSSEGRPIRVGNGMNGIAVAAPTTFSAVENNIGGNSAGQGNLIGANAHSGIYLSGANVQYSDIRGNRIGIKGASDLGNDQHGVSVGSGLVTIGGNATTVPSSSCANSCNVISGNDGDGVHIVAQSDVLVVGNWIGPAETGTVARGNGATGVRMQGCLNCTVDYNVVSGNGASGVSVDNTVTGSQVTFNRIGTNPAGSAALANNPDGIRLNNVGTTSGRFSVASNTISGNTNAGITMISSSSVDVEGNVIGARADDPDLPLPNARGIQMEDASDLVFADNRIGNSTNFGIYGYLVSDITMSGNLVHDSGNAGCLLSESHAVQIGDPSSTSNADVYQDNGGSGVLIGGNSYDVQVNALFFRNGLDAGPGLGIELSGFAGNDSGDGDTGPNNLQNYPDLISATWNPSAETVTIKYNVDSDPANATYPIAVRFYAEADNQGFHLLGTDVKTESDGVGPKTAVLPYPASLGSILGMPITATATDTWITPETTLGNTSQFSPSIGPNTVSLLAAAWLQGPYVGGSMTLDLGSKIPTSQPYDVSPWLHTDDREVAPPASAVDWILLELRSGDPEGTMTTVARKAAFIASNGSIIDRDGYPFVRFPDVAFGSYHVVIWHRNHVPLMSRYLINFAGGTGSWDLRGVTSGIHGGTLAVADLGDGNIGLIAGDSDGNGQVQNVDEHLHVLPAQGMTSYGVNNGWPDLDLSGLVDQVDVSLWAQNNGRGTQVPSE